ncbi:type II toxin-antitoxin system VapC family toxin [Massilia glaciei]|uniref:Ribonuclease VapC n=1 Tax=Massilia glaciei TaxID=1524097 RepID=A0A2U2HIS5_9BURK|nr:type II toxin-antitoxin system VapC family toxin [Massilia glaciei]PWF46714.1 type II toxin-antitoxin system VapC family toxin [Massilia glaciei]
MLDTNTVSDLLKGGATVARLQMSPVADVCISAVTEGELLFWLAKRPGATRLHAAVREFLRHVESVPWDSDAAASYGTLRASMTSSGKVLGALDMMIAAHALAIGLTLVTHDQAFSMVPGLLLDDWN